MNIKTADLLNECSTEQRESIASRFGTLALLLTCVAKETILTLLDPRGRPAGFLVVRLQKEADSAPRRTDEADEHHAEGQVVRQGSNAPQLSPKSIQLPINSATAKHVLENDIIESLKEVVDK